MIPNPTIQRAINKDALKKSIREYIKLNQQNKSTLKIVLVEISGPKPITYVYIILDLMTSLKVVSLSFVNVIL